jgi:hypothetical protein
MLYLTSFHPWFNSLLTTLYMKIATSGYLEHEGPIFFALFVSTNLNTSKSLGAVNGCVGLSDVALLKQGDNVWCVAQGRVSTSALAWTVGQKPRQTTPLPSSCKYNEPIVSLFLFCEHSVI